MSIQNSLRLASIVDLLVHENVISLDEAVHIREDSRAKGQPILQYLLDNRYVKSQKHLFGFVAKALNTKFVDLSETLIADNMSSIIKYDMAKHYNIIPLYTEGTKLYVATTVDNLENLPLYDRLRKTTGYKDIVFHLAVDKDIANSLNDLYRLDDELRELGIGADEDAAGDTVNDIDAAETIVDESDAAKFVRLAITQAVIDRASDIIFESHENYLSLRYRIDGVFHEKQRASRSMSDEIISVIKIQAELDISVRKRAQDGRLSIIHEGERVDLRVNIFPIQDGENVTMRILDNSQANLRLDQLGFSEKNLKRFRDAIKKPYGMVLLTGPTGSGKSVTLYSGLREVASPELNVLTIEDPIEYRVPHVKQSQLNIKQGWTYPEAIRAFMRAAPNIILVGEIRDFDTASTALQAGMTGHLVLSTLHTNSASEVPSRLMDLGVQSHIISSTLTCMVGQRLIRRLCSKCKIPHEPTPEELLAVNFPWQEGDELPALYGPKPGGCKECSGIGFKGRVAAHEVLVVDSKMRSLISKRAEAHEIEAFAMENGMTKMIDDGWEKVLQGVTTIQEVLKSIV